MKNPVYRSFFSFLLSFTFLATTIPFQKNFKAQAQTQLQFINKEPKSPRISAKEERQRSLGELHASVLNPEKNAHLDPFQMLKQGVIDEHPQNSEALRENTLLEDYQERIQFLERDIRTLQSVIAKLKKKKVEAKTEIQKAQSIFYVDDAKSRLAFAQSELDDLRSLDPLNGKDMNVDIMTGQPRVRHYWGNRMRLQISQGGRIVTEVKQRDFTQSLSPGFSKNNPLSDFRGHGKMTFTITDPRGRRLHEFFTPIEAVFFFAEYLVYIESSQLTKNEKTLMVRFVDLNYVRVNIGNAPLPVFTLPLKSNQKPTDFKIENGFLKIGDNPISYPQLALVSRMNQTLFNVAVSLIDPESYKRARALIGQILEFLKKSMQAQGSLFREQFDKAIAADEYLKRFTKGFKETNPVNANQLQDLIRKSLVDGQISHAEYDHLKEYLFANNSLTHSNQALFESRRLMNRIHLLMRFLAQPRPEGSPKIQQALVMLASSSREHRKRSLEFVKDSFSLKLLKYGTAAGVAATMAMTFPDSLQIHIYKSLDLISAIQAHFSGYMEHIDYGRAYVYLSKDAFVRVATGVTYFYDSYIVESRWTKLIYGFTVIFTEILKPLAAIHFTVNSFAALKGTWTIRSLSHGQLGWLASFYHHSRQAKEKYWKEKSMDVEISGGGRVSDISAREEQLLLDYLERLRQGRASTEDLIREIESGKTGPGSFFSNSRLKALKDRLSQDGFKKTLLSLLRLQETDRQRASRDYKKSVDSYHKMLAFSESMGKTYEEVAQNFPKKRVRAVRMALANTFLSYPAVIRSFRTALLVWNYPYLIQTYFYSPRKWLMFLIYPNFFNVTMNSREGEQHFPSRYNGGLESWPGKWHRKVSGFVNNTSRLLSPVVNNFSETWISRQIRQIKGYLYSGNSRFFLNQLIFSEKGLKDLSEFESEIIKVEAEIIKLAKERAQRALMESIGDPARLQMIFDSSQKQETSSIGINQLHDPKIKKLTPGERLFYRAYFTRTFELLMQSFILEITSIKFDNPMDSLTFSKNFIRKLREGQIDSINITKKSVKNIRQNLEKNIDYEQVRNWAYGLSHRGEEFLRRMDIQFRMKLLQSIHPENEQLGRVFTASRMAKKPQAMDRATRAQISSVFSSIPIAIGSTLLLFASVQSGLLQPFDPTGMDSNTHFHYMSRYLFWTGFIPSILLGIVAGTWLKVQEDSRIEEQGGFDRIVKHSDGQRGFWRYYFKNIFKNPANNWRANQLHYLKIIWHNMPAASVTMIATSLYGLGRVDLGIFISGYVVILATPLVGFGMQLGQAFELASAWVKSKIPRKFRAHRAAMQYVDLQIQMYKIKQSYIMRFFDIIIASGIMGELLTLADNARYGTRAFIRLIFGGNTLAEIINGFTDKMIEAFKSIPGIEPGMQAVRSVFTNNFEAWQRFPKDLIKANPGVEQVHFNPRPPQNTLGEVAGKTTAMLTSLGLITSTPYIGSRILQSINEKRVQQKGAQTRCSTLFAR